ncbi:MAG: hypothetical protein QHC90_24020 [Shinella sp.]|nr:hypothetical protein [Shinella sp.]
MAFVRTRLVDFERQKRSLSHIYSGYRDEMSEGLWYAEAITGKDVAEFASRPVVIRDGYWGGENPHIGHIVGNVYRHLDAVQRKEEPSRLSQKNAEDDEWRAQDPAFFDAVLRRYGPDVAGHKIDQTVSIVDFSGESLTIQRSCYLDQLGSNIFCDKPVGVSGDTLRTLNLSDGKALPFSESTLANTIGVSAVFVGRDGIPLLRWRQQQKGSRRMAIMESGWHCTASGVLTWQDFTSAAKDGRTTVASVVNGILRESAYEAGIGRTDEFYDLKLVAFARELKRAGKPQFFFVLRFPDHTAAEIRDIILGRELVEGDEYGRQSLRRSIAMAFRPKSAGVASDFLIDDRLILDRLMPARLESLSTAEDGIHFTFEAYANLFFALKDKPTGQPT